MINLYRSKEMLKKKSCFLLNRVCWGIQPVHICMTMCISPELLRISVGITTSIQAHAVGGLIVHVLNHAVIAHREKQRSWWSIMHDLSSCYIFRLTKEVLLYRNHDMEPAWNHLTMPYVTWYISPIHSLAIMRSLVMHAYWETRCLVREWKRSLCHCS